MVPRYNGSCWGEGVMLSQHALKFADPNFLSKMSWKHAETKFEVQVSMGK